MNNAAEKLQERRWKLAMELVKKQITNTLNYKYGWQNNDELQDTEQEILLITYEIITLYEEKNHCVLSAGDIPQKLKKELMCNIIGKYRLKVWNNRSNNAMRKSDIYNNVDVGSLEDSNVYCASLTDIGIPIETSIDTDDIDIVEMQKRRTVLCYELTSILKSDVESIINACMLGTDDKGILTHAEIAKKTNKCRSGITRRINRAIVTLSKFVENNNISYRQILSPSKEDAQLISDIIKTYKNNSIVKSREKVQVDDVCIFNIEDYLNNNTHKQSKSNICNQPVKKKAAYKRKKTAVLYYGNLAVNIRMHSIEEYL